MNHANDNKTTAFKALDNLPLFASDKDIAVAIVGPKRASEWLRTSFPRISALRGFPPIDAMHGGRATVKVAKFYEGYIGVTGLGVNEAPDGGDSEWKRPNRRA